MFRYTVTVSLPQPNIVLGNIYKTIVNYLAVID